MNGIASTLRTLDASKRLLAAPKNGLGGRHPTLELGKIAMKCQRSFNGTKGGCGVAHQQEWPSLD